VSGPPPFPRPLRRFVELFNDEAFWESHEALEAAWRDARSPFYHGLILVVSAFVHAQRGNTHGVRAQLAKAERVLDEWRPAYLGVDVDGLLAAAANVRDAVVAGRAAVFPRLVLRDGLRRGDEWEARRLEAPPEDA